MESKEAKTISQRVLFYMQDLNLPKKRIARIMGIDEEEFDKHISKNSFTDDHLTKLSENIGEIRYTWLVLGAGSAYTKKPSNKDVYDYSGVNDFVIKVREAHGYTQAEFAEIMGIARTTQSAIERNKQTITIGYMRRLHQKFKVPYHAIIDQVEKDVDTINEIGKLRKQVEHYKAILKKLGAEEGFLNGQK